MTRFAVRTDFLAAYKVEVVGASHHAEYWIPAADLTAFNDAIIGLIEITATFGTGKLDSNDKSADRTV